MRIECADKKRAEWHFCYSALFPHCPSGYGDIVFYCLINENRRVPRLFVVLPKNAVGIIWKTLKKVAKISFSRVCMPDKKNRRSPLIIWGGRLLLYPRLLLCSACEIIHAYAVQVCKAHQCLYIRFILADFIARQSDHIDARPLGCFLLGQPALFSGFL